MKRLIASLAAATLLASGSMVQAATPTRASAPLSAENEMGGSLSISVLIVLATVLGGAIWLLVDNDDDPDSP